MRPACHKPSRDEEGACGIAIERSDAKSPGRPAESALTAEAIGPYKARTRNGAVAQLGERCNRTAEVVSSNLISSTRV